MTNESKQRGELSPLEIGIHALEAVAKGKAGRGKKGWLSEYAKLIGKTQGYVSQLVHAAEVIKSISQLMDLTALANKTQHLCAIHGAPEKHWAALVEAMLKRDWSSDGYVGMTQTLRQRSGPFPRDCGATSFATARRQGICFPCSPDGLPRQRLFRTI